MTTTRAGSETLHDALAHLNEASKESREEVQKLLVEKYANLKNSFGGATSASAGWVKEQRREAVDKARLTAGTVDRSVRRYLWAYVGVGLLAGRRKQPDAR